MKDETLQLLKFKSLKRRLKLRTWQAVGLLESLWLLARQNCRLGDIGRFSNEEIAAEIEWEGDADEMIAILVDVRWLDIAPAPYRLVCHDWPENAPTFIVRWIGNSLGLKDPKTATPALMAAWRSKIFGGICQPFRGQSPPEIDPEPTPNSPEPTPNGPTRARIPNPTQPNPTPPNQTEPWAEVEEELFSHEMFKAPEAIAAVRAAGCSIGEVRNLIEFWRPRREEWGVGMLYERLLALRPGQGFDRLWPASTALSPTIREISTADFMEHWKLKRFKDGPNPHGTEADCYLGTLRDGTKVMCRGLKRKQKV